MPAAASATPAWSFVVHEPGSGPVRVDWELRGLAGHVRLCSDQEGGGAYVRAFELRTASGTRPLARDPADPDCWTADAPRDGRLALEYTFDLDRLARESWDPDTAVQAAGGYIFCDEALLLRPDPLPPDGTIDVTFDLPAGWKAVAPWEAVPGAPFHFRTTAEQFDDGSYVAIGPRLNPWPPVVVRGGTLDLTLVGQPGRASASVVRDWVAAAGRRVADFYGGLPAPQVEVLLVPAPVGGRAGLFGSTMRHGHPSIVLVFAADGSPADFAGDWMPTHELFHLGNPDLQERVTWFTEGVATYYQDVLRARSDPKAAAAFWGDLYDGFRRFCDPEGGASLEQESHDLSRTHHYRRVYWGAACLFFQVDVAIRARSHDRESLDDVVRALLHRGREEPLSEAELIGALDEAAGRPLARELLEARHPVSLAPTYERLGIVPTGPSSVKLRDDAPLAWVRKGIFR